MKFDERFYPEHVTRSVMQRKCESQGCNTTTSWRYDKGTGDDRIFFACCSTEHMEAILAAGIRNPTGDLLRAVASRKAAIDSLRDVFS